MLNGDDDALHCDVPRNSAAAAAADGWQNVNAAAADAATSRLVGSNPMSQDVAAAATAAAAASQQVLSGHTGATRTAPQAMPSKPAAAAAPDWPTLNFAAAAAPGAATPDLGSNTDFRAVAQQLLQEIRNATGSNATASDTMPHRPAAATATDGRSPSTTAAAAAGAAAALELHSNHKATHSTSAAAAAAGFLPSFMYPGPDFTQDDTPSGCPMIAPEPSPVQSLPTAQAKAKPATPAAAAATGGGDEVGSEYDGVGDEEAARILVDMRTGGWAAMAAGGGAGRPAAAAAAVGGQAAAAAGAGAKGHQAASRKRNRGGSPPVQLLEDPYL